LTIMSFGLYFIFCVIVNFTFTYFVFLFNNCIVGIAVVVFIAMATFYITLFYGMLLKPYQNVLIN